MRGWLVNGIPIVVAVVVGLGAVFLTASRQAPPPIEIRAPELVATPTVVIYVHVDGAVTRPGVYTLATGGRIFEAIEAAGGATEDADSSGLNLAAKAADGQKLVVPLKRVPSENIDSLASPRPPASNSVPTDGAGTTPTIGINSASQRILESLPGIGPVTAGRIVTRRTTTGPFTRIEQLREERLVNATTYERIKNLISAD